MQFLGGSPHPSYGPADQYCLHTMFVDFEGEIQNKTTLRFSQKKKKKDETICDENKIRESRDPYMIRRNLGIFFLKK